MPTLKVDGVCIRYVQELAGSSGPPEVREEPLDVESTIVFIHGFPDSAFSFSKMRDALRFPAKVRLLSLDLVGYGESDKPLEQQRYSLEEQAAVIAAGLGELLQPGRVIDLVGHSMGAGVSIAMAMKYPELVRSLFLIGPASSYAQAVTDPDKGLKALVEREGFELTETFIREFQCGKLADQDFPGKQAFVDQLVQESLKMSTASFKLAVEGMQHDGFLTDVGSIKCRRTKLLTGTNDMVCPPLSHIHMLGIKFPRSSVTLVQDAGHAPHWEKPELVAQLLAEHLAAMESEP